jgi:hypothetical protein
VPSMGSQGHSVQRGGTGNAASTPVSPKVIQRPTLFFSLKHGGSPES